MDSLIFELQIVLYFQLFLSANVRHMYAAFDGEGGGRQGCGLDLAPFWYTSPFKLCAPFHLISPLSVGFPRNSFLSLERYVTLACYVRVHSNYKHHFDRIFHCSPTQHVICPVSVG